MILNYGNTSYGNTRMYNTSTVMVTFRPQCRQCNTLFTISICSSNEPKPKIMISSKYMMTFSKSSKSDDIAVWNNSVATSIPMGSILYLYTPKVSISHDTSSQLHLIPLHSLPCLSSKMSPTKRIQTITKSHRFETGEWLVY